MDEKRLIATIRKSERCEVRVTLGTYKGRPVLNAWEWYRDKSGDFYPGRRGLMLGQDLAPAFAEGLAVAVAEIRAGRGCPVSPPGAEAHGDAPNAFARGKASGSESPGQLSQARTGDTQPAVLPQAGRMLVPGSPGVASTASPRDTGPQAFSSPAGGRGDES